MEEISKKELKRERAAFVAGFARGMSIAGVFFKHKAFESENEEADFLAGQVYGAILISVIALACVVIFWVPGGG